MDILSYALSCILCEAWNENDKYQGRKPSSLPWAPVVALVFGQALKAAEEGMVQFHSFPSDQPALGTSQPQDALVGQLVPVAPGPGGSVGLANLCICEYCCHLGWSSGTKVQGHHALCLEAHWRCWGDLVNLLYTRLYNKKYDGHLWFCDLQPEWLIFRSLAQEDRPLQLSLQLVVLLRREKTPRLGLEQVPVCTPVIMFSLSHTLCSLESLKSKTAYQHWFVW